MDDLVKEIYRMIESVSETLGRKLTSCKEIKIEDSKHYSHDQPKKLEKGYAAVYSFIDKNGKFLKIGKANEKSQARYVSQHYGFSAPSTLAKSICNDKQMQEHGAKEEEIKEWILNNTRRINILIKCDNSEDNRWATDLIEAIMHYKFEPKYEGKNANL